MFVTIGSARPGWHRVDLRGCRVCWELAVLGSQAKSKEQGRWQAQLSAFTPRPTRLRLLWQGPSDHSARTPSPLALALLSLLKVSHQDWQWNQPHPQPQQSLSTTAGNQKPSHLLDQFRQQKSKAVCSVLRAYGSTGQPWPLASLSLCSDGEYT